MAPSLDKILIANRGEIARRITRTAKKLGIKVVGVFSSADRCAQHTEDVDECYFVGPAPSSQSYLNGEKIAEIAQKSGCKAVHPGYGFLSENYRFAELLEEKGISFIGPSPQAMKDMAIKNKAKEIMSAAGVPVVPGYNGDDQTPTTLHNEARKIGFPIMIKATLGGGGKGMRIVERDEDFINALNSAKNESKKHFKDDSVILEKYIKRSRHIEVQVFGDKHGNTVALFERDCSVQRRHQKVLEEAPAPHLLPEQRKSLMKMAVDAAKAVKYVGAGTVEFIYDCDQEEFYFMEMNTRLQVEHPVTEMITNQDLVQWQLLVGAGMELPRKQEELSINGHAIEARIYAEKTKNNFLPDVGKIKFLHFPQANDRLRVETGLRKDDEVSIYYDPMIAKVIVYGDDRSEAVMLMEKALSEIQIVGVETNVDFLRRVLQSEIYREGDTDKVAPNCSKFVKDNIDVPEEKIALAGLSASLLSKKRPNNVLSPWFAPFAFQSLTKISFQSHLRCENNEFDFTATPTGEDFTQLQLKSPQRKDGVTIDFLEDGSGVVMGGEKLANLKVYVEEDGLINFFCQSSHIKVSKRNDLNTLSSSSDENNLCSPMTCRVFDIKTQPGSQVKKGQILLVVEAMKMEHYIVAPRDGQVEEIRCSKGDVVQEGQILLKLAVA